MLSIAAMDASGYSTREVADMLGLPETRVRTFVRERFLSPLKGARGEMRFSFQDLVLLRTAKSLAAADIPPARVRKALRNLKEQLPADRPLSGVSIAADGDRIVVRDGEVRWNAESGQSLLNFQVRELVDQVAPLPDRNGRFSVKGPADAESWYAAGCMLEAADPERSVAAYRKAIELEPTHADAHINLGRLLQQLGQNEEVEAHYRAALEAAPEDGTAWFNLGTWYEEQSLWQDAADAYSEAIRCEPESPDAYFNLSQLCERAGRRTDALRMLKTYRQLVHGQK
jgi:tetratricopeptide (TPR) repeat protein